MVLSDGPIPQEVVDGVSLLTPAVDFGSIADDDIHSDLGVIINHFPALIYGGDKVGIVNSTAVHAHDVRVVRQSPNLMRKCEGNGGA